MERKVERKADSLTVVKAKLAFENPEILRNEASKATRTKEKL